MMIMRATRTTQRYWRAVRLEQDQRLSLVTHGRYAAALRAAWDADPKIGAYVTDYRFTANITGDAYLSGDRKSGFIVADGELRGVFSLVRGRGDMIVRRAIMAGADHLDCFDGYLPTLYARHGFREVHREANWTAGGPDVVYMAL